MTYMSNLYNFEIVHIQSKKSNDKFMKQKWDVINFQILRPESEDISIEDTFPPKTKNITRVKINRDNVNSREKTLSREWRSTIWWNFLEFPRASDVRCLSSDGKHEAVYSCVTTFLELETWRVSGEPSALEKVESSSKRKREREGK